MEHYKHFCNKDCEFYPCHKNIREEDFNCLFCYCPLYWSDCGGNFTMIKGIKDCSECVIPHKRSNYDYIIGKLSEHFKNL